MNRGAIIDLVIVKMEEHTPFMPTGDSLLAGGDELDEVKPIYHYIEENLQEAADEMLLTASLHRLDKIAVGWIPHESGNTSGEVNCGYYVSKPDDYLRLYSAKLKSWRRVVHEVVRPDDAMYALQYNPWTRGTAQKPVVVDKGDQHPLECFSAKEVHPTDNTEISNGEFKYIQHFNADTNYPKDVAELIALNTARKVYEIFGNTEMVTQMTNEIKQVLQVMAT